MQVLILYESFFGNTQKIAETIGAAIEGAEEVNIREISTIDPKSFDHPDLLIIGSPTRGFRPSPATIAFLANLPKNSLKDQMVAAYDTRIALSYIKSGVLRFFVKAGGYAAKIIERKMKQKGGIPILPCEGFCVTGNEGPLLDGEIERAKEWASNIKTWHSA
jgi:flavodoxin